MSANHSRGRLHTADMPFQTKRSNQKISLEKKKNDFTFYLKKHTKKGNPENIMKQ